MFRCCVIDFYFRQVLQELTAKEEGDWTPLMAAAESGSVDCFHEVLHAIQERGSEDSVSARFEQVFGEGLLYTPVCTMAYMDKLVGQMLQIETMLHLERRGMRA